jgi:hypothetical protein
MYANHGDTEDTGNSQGRVSGNRVPKNALCASSVFSVSLWLTYVVSYFLSGVWYHALPLRVISSSASFGPHDPAA